MFSFFFLVDICENKTLKNPQWNDYNCNDQADGNSSCEGT